MKWISFLPEKMQELSDPEILSCMEKFSRTIFRNTFSFAHITAATMVPRVGVSTVHLWRYAVCGGRDMH